MFRDLLDGYVKQSLVSLFFVDNNKLVSLPYLLTDICSILFCFYPYLRLQNIFQKIKQSEVDLGSLQHLIWFLKFYP